MWVPAAQWVELLTGNQMAMGSNPFRDSEVFSCEKKEACDNKNNSFTKKYCLSQMVSCVSCSFLYVYKQNLVFESNDSPKVTSSIGC